MGKSAILLSLIDMTNHK